MTTYPKTAALGALGLPRGDHWLRVHVEDDVISVELTASSAQEVGKPGQPTGFVQRWGGTARKLADTGDAWLAHINGKHVR